MLTLYMHPLASYCWKVLIGLYETELAFVAKAVDLADPQERAAFHALWPIGKFPVLVDGARCIPESTTILEHLARLSGTLISDDPDVAAETRAQDRFFDLYVHEPMQKVVDDRLRPVEAKDSLGVSRARGTLAIAYGLIEGVMSRRTWAAGETFSLADCAAFPALYYANEVAPLGPQHAATASYLARLHERPSVARVLREAAPFLHLFPRG